MEKMIILTLILAVSGVYSDDHSLRYYDTGVSAPGSRLPKFSTVGYVDDREIMNYNSDTGRAQPKVPWMEKVEAGFWEEETQRGKQNEAVMRHDVRTVMSRFNDTGGFHIVQRMYGCERGDDGFITGYMQYAYDSRDFLVLETRTGTYVPTMAQAQMSAQYWNSPEVQEGERQKHYLENTCINSLQDILEFGREDVERRVQPQVKVSGQEKDGSMKLHCQVYGFYPRAVDVNWMNGEDEVQLYETTYVLPNPDGTYQIRVSAEVTPKDGDSYSCYVDHSSLEEPLFVKWEPNLDSTLTVIISAVIIIILIAGVLTFAGVIIYKKKKADFVRANDTGSDTSSVSSVSVIA